MCTIPFTAPQVQYDVMDVDAKQFDEDFYAFRVVIKELERRLAAIIIQVGGGGCRGAEVGRKGREEGSSVIRAQGQWSGRGG